MNDSELYDNFYLACYLYAYNQGPTPIVDLPPNDFVDVLYESGEVNIQTWNHVSSQPSDATLKLFTLNDMEISKNLYTRQKIMNGDAITMDFSSNISLIGPWSGSQNVNIPISIQKKNIHLEIPDIDFSGNNTSSVISSSEPISILIRPLKKKSWTIVVKDNGVLKVGCLDIDTSGNLTICAGVDGASFSSGTGMYGCNSTSVSYNL